MRLSGCPTPSAVPERLSPRLVDVHGGPSRTAFTASVVIVIAAFLVAFVIARDSTGAEPRPAAASGSGQRGAASNQHRTGVGAVELRPVAALPDLRPDPRPRHRSPSPPRSASPAPTVVTAAPVPASTPAPVVPAPEPTSAPVAPAPAAPAPAPRRPSPWTAKRHRRSRRSTLPGSSIRPGDGAG